MGGPATALWSNPATWGGALPTSSTDVTITSAVTLDTNTAVARNIVVGSGGVFRLDGGANLALTCESIEVLSGGSLLVGDVTLYGGRLVVTLTGSTRREIIAREGSTVILRAVAPTPHVTYLNANQTTGATTLPIANNLMTTLLVPPAVPVAQLPPPDDITLTGWGTGQEIGIGPSDFFHVGRSEVRALDAAGGGNLVLSSGLSRPRWGAKQWVNETPSSPGFFVSFTRQASFLPTDISSLPIPHDIPIEQRTPIVNLYRGITIQAANDAQWASGFGVHCRFEGITGTRLVLDGIEVRRGGKAGINERYPIHVFCKSWNVRDGAGGTVGAFLGDVTHADCTIRNSLVRESIQRGFVLQATCGALLENNVVYDVTGPGLVLHDGSERRNTIDGNVVMLVRAPLSANRLHPQEVPLDPNDLHTNGKGGFGGVPGAYIRNMNNFFRNNRVCDSEAIGWRFDVPRIPSGRSASIPNFFPRHQQITQWLNNFAHSTRRNGAVFRKSDADAGGILTDQFNPTFNEGLPSSPADARRSQMDDFHIYKTGDNPYANSVYAPIYHRWTVSDFSGLAAVGENGDRVVNGATGGILLRSFIIGRTLNNANEPDLDPLSPYTTYAAHASYHYGFSSIENVFVNFPELPGKYYYGAIDHGDLYFRPVERGTVLSPRNRLIGCHPGLNIQSPNMGGPVLNGSPPALNGLSGVKWDPYGYQSGFTNRGNWHAYDIPFFTHGGGIMSPPPVPGATGVILDGGVAGFGGLLNFKLPDQTGFNYATALRFTRLTTGNTPVSGPAWDFLDQSANPGYPLRFFRHGAVRNNGRYRVEFPGYLPTRVYFGLENFYHGAGQSVLVAVSFSGAVDPSQMFMAGVDPSLIGGLVTRSSINPAHRRDYVATGSLATVESSPAGLYFRDVPNNLVWFKIAGDVPNQWTPSDADDFGRYQPGIFVIQA
jgi:hypothetical protein